MAIGNWGISGESQSYGRGYYPQIDYESGELFDGPLGPCDENENFSIMLFGVNGNVNSTKNYGMCGCDDNLVCWFTGTTGSIRIASEGNTSTSAGTWNFKTRVVDDCASTLKRSSDACVSGECMFKYNNFDFSNYITNGGCGGTVTGNTTWPQGINEYKNITVTNATHVIRYCLHEEQFCFSSTINLCPNLVGLYIPKSVKYINDGAFSGNTGLSKVFLRSDNELITIGNNAFSGNEKMDIIMVDTNYAPKPPLTGITISSSNLNSISQTAFKGVNVSGREIVLSGCTNLSAITLFEGVSSNYTLQLPSSITAVTSTTNSSQITDLYIYATTAPRIDGSGTGKITKLHVPIDKKSDYEAQGWGNFCTYGNNSIVDDLQT